MDQLIYAFSPTKNISLTYADVTEAAKKLEKKHLSGPAAGRFLGELLAASAIVSADLGDKDEKVSIQVRVTGPVTGGVADVTRDGNLRGYTQIKLIKEFDEKEDSKVSDIVGDAGEMTVIRHNSRMMLENKQIRCDPFVFKHALARYYNDKKQPTGIEIVAKSQNFYLDRVCGLRITRNAEGNCEDFVPMLEKLNDHTIEKALAQNVDIKEIAKCFGLEDLKIVECRPLTANCTCSREKVIYSISCLPVEELTEIIEKREEPEVSCHFCSTTYRIKTEEVVAMLRNKGK